MRKQFITIEEAENLPPGVDIWDICPWASVIRETEGGFLMFESLTDAKTWDSQ